MQSVSPRIWTRVDASISYDDNHYTTGTGSEYELLTVILKLILVIALNIKASLFFY